MAGLLPPRVGLPGGALWGRGPWGGDGRVVSWSVVVPVKALGAAKSRLRLLGTLYPKSIWRRIVHPFGSSDTTAQ